MQERPNADNDSELLRLLARDSEYAFAVIFDRHRKRVYNAALVFLKSPEAAEEVVQEVFLRLWQKRKRLPDIHYLNSFIRTVAYNLMVDQFRKTVLEKDYKKQLGRDAAMVDDADHRVRDNESVRLLQAAIATLPQRQRQVYELARLKGFSQEEIAAALSISKNTVKVHMTAALQGIRSYLASHYPDTLGSIPFLLLMACMANKLLSD
jgi:RNA polymerase sigma-70 factor (family 1)